MNLRYCTPLYCQQLRRSSILLFPERLGNLRITPGNAKVVAENRHDWRRIIPSLTPTPMVNIVHDVNGVPCDDSSGDIDGRIKQNLRVAACFQKQMRHP